MTLELESQSESHTIDIAGALARLLRPGDVICLHGELGAGKTCFVRGLARGLGLDPSAVSSPTFVIIHEYTPRAIEVGSATSMPRLVHVDAYRLHGEADLDTLGWDRVMDGSAVVVIEWPERIESASSTSLPPRGTGDRRTDVTLQPTAPTHRRITIEAPPAWSFRPGAAALLLLAADPSRPTAPLPEGWARCPVSGKPVPPDSPTFPFADDKCRLADLNRWFTGAYRLSREVEPDDLDDPGLPHVGPTED